MVRMIRKQVYIEPRQDALIKRLVRETGVTEADIIRQAIDAHTGALVFRRDLMAWQAEKDFIHQLMAQGAVAGGRTWRREDLYE